MKALVIGAGGVGRAILNIAARRSFITSLVVADRTLARAQDAVQRLKDPRFSAAQVNAAELEDLRELIRKADPDVVINAVDPRFVMPIFLACEIENTNYIDMAMSLSRPHPHYPHRETGVKLGDEPERCYYLKLLKPIDVFPVLAEKSLINDAVEKDVNVIQLSLRNDSLSGHFKKIGFGKKVKLKGSLFHRHTGHHHTNVLMSVDDILDE